MIKMREGSNVTLNVIQKKMLTAVSLPLPEECPTALRYALAKYAATAVADAWDGLRELEEQGELQNQA